MKTCDKCGSNNLKYAGNDNASGINKEMYQCQDCGQITFFLADEAESKSACLPSYVPRWCFSEIILHDNKTGEEHILGGGYGTDLLDVIQNELAKIMQKVSLLK